MTGRPAFLPLPGAGGSRVGHRTSCSNAGGGTRCSPGAHAPGSPAPRSPGACAPPRDRGAPARAVRAGTPDAARPGAGRPDRGAARHPGRNTGAGDRGRRKRRPRPPLAAARKPTPGCGIPRRFLPADGSRPLRRTVPGYPLPRVEPPVILTRCGQSLYLAFRSGPPDQRAARKPPRTGTRGVVHDRTGRPPAGRVPVPAPGDRFGAVIRGDQAGTTAPH